MANNVIEVVVKLVDQLSDPLDKMLGPLKDFKGLLATIGIGFSLHHVIDQMKEASDAAGRLGVALKTNAGFVGLTQETLQRYAEQLEKTSAFSHVAVERGEALLLQFRNIRGEVFELATHAMVDLAAKMGSDVPGAAQLLGKALQDPERGMQQLRRAGIILVESQKEQIKQLIDLGDVQGAQKIILQQVANQAGGTAEALRHTLGGSIEAVKNEFNKLFEGRPEDVKKLTDSFLGLADILSDKELKASLDTVMVGFIEALKEVIKLIAGVIQGWTFLISLVSHDQQTMRDTLLEKQSNLGANLNAALDRREQLRNPAFGNKLERDENDKRIEELRAEIRKVQDELSAHPVFKGLTPDVYHSVAEAQAAAESAKRPFDVSKGMRKDPEIERLRAILDEQDKHLKMAQQEYKQYDHTVMESINAAFKEAEAIGEVDQAYQEATGALAAFRKGGETALETFQQQSQVEAEMAKRADQLGLSIKELERQYPGLRHEIDETFSNRQALEKMREFGAAGEEAARNIQDAFAEAFMHIGTGGTNLAKEILDAFRKMWAQMLALAIIKALGIEQIMKNLANSIASILQEALGGSGSGGLLGQIFQGVVGGVTGAAAGAGGAPVVASTHGPYASGTSSAEGGWSMVGEEGPELVRLPAGTRVSSANDTKNMKGSAKAVSYAPSTVLNVYGTGAVTQEQLAEVLAKNNRATFIEFNRVMADNGVQLR